LCFLHRNVHLYHGCSNEREQTNIILMSSLRSVVTSMLLKQANYYRWVILSLICAEQPHAKCCYSRFFKAFKLRLLNFFRLMCNVLFASKDIWETMHLWANYVCFWYSAYLGYKDLILYLVKVMMILSKPFEIKIKTDRHTSSRNVLNCPLEEPVVNISSYKSGLHQVI